MIKYGTVVGGSTIIIEKMKTSNINFYKSLKYYFIKRKKERKKKETKIER